MRGSRARYGLALAALLAARPGSATAADLFELLDWACNPTAEARKGIGDREALSTCHMTAGAGKKACDVVAGEPFHCFEPQTYRGGETCEYNDVVLTIKASTKQTLGWKIEGIIVVDAGYKVDFEGDECRPSVRATLDDTGTGTFVRRAGTAKLHAEFHASGEGYITFLGGKLFGTKYTEKCVGDAAPTGYLTDEKSGCKARCAPSRLSGVAAEICEPPPSPSPSPSPPPSPSPSPLPSPSPAPLPSPSPPATPAASSPSAGRLPERSAPRDVTRYGT